MHKEKVGIAVIGVGRVGITHLDGVKRNDDKATIAAVIDIDESRAKKVANDFSTKYYTSIESALKDPEIDAVVICLSHDLHHPIAMQSMKANKHVLVEKPFALTVRDADEMINLSKEKDLVLMAGMSRRHFLAFHELKKRFAASIGEPFNMLYTMAFYFDENTAPAWWRSEAKTGGLSLPMLGSHSIDFTLWMFERKKPIRVYAEAKDVNPRLEGYDEITLLMKFDDGSIATNFLSLNTKPSRYEGLIIGLKGSAYFSHSGDHVGLIGTANTNVYINGEVIMEGEQNPHAFAVQIREFASAILETREPWVKLDVIRTQVRIMEAAKESIRIGKPIDL